MFNKLNGVVTVIIPTHNRCYLLKDAINSVLKQTYQEYEIVVVDDNSVDDTREFVSSLDDGRIRYFRNETSLGAAASRNRGIEEAKGEFVAFLDDDDEWFSNKLENQIPLFDDSSVGLVYCGVEMNFESYGIVYSTVPKVRGYVYKDVLMRNCIGGPPAVVIRRSLLGGIDWFDTDFLGLEDYDLWIRIAKNCSVDYVKATLLRANYRSTVNEVSANIENYISAIERINVKYEDDVGNMLTPKERQKRKAFQEFLLGSQAVKIGNSRVAREKFLRAFLASGMKKALIAYLLSFLGVKTVLLFRAYQSHFFTVISNKNAGVLKC